MQYQAITLQICLHFLLYLHEGNDYYLYYFYYLNFTIIYRLIAINMWMNKTANRQLPAKLAFKFQGNIKL